MRLTASLLAVLLLTACKAQTSTDVSPNFIIPKTPPAAPISAWVDAGTRTAVSLEVGGATLRGFSYKGSDASAPAVLFFNGNGMTVLASSGLYEHLASLGPTVVAYDYRAYGFSTGTADLMTYRADALQLYDAVAASAPGHRVVVYGFSMGTVMASYVASEREVAGLILGAPISSATAEYPVYGRLLGYSSEYLDTHKPSADAVVAFGEAELVKRSKAPLLVLHGTEDKVIPVDQARAVLDASAAAEKRIVILPRAGHNETVSEPGAYSAFVKFMGAVGR